MLDLSKEYLSLLHSLIEEGKDRALIKKLEPLHANDIALILNQIKRDDVHYLYRLLADDARSDVIAELDEEVREDLLATLTSKEIAEDVIDGLASDDATDIISELSSEKIEEVFSHVKDKESVSDVKSLLEYPEGTAGALMIAGGFADSIFLSVFPFHLLRIWYIGFLYLQIEHGSLLQLLQHSTFLLP